MVAIGATLVRLKGCLRCVSGSVLQSVVMACLCSTLKLQTADRLPYSVPTLLSHITNNKMSLDRVLRVRWESCTFPVGMLQFK